MASVTDIHSFGDQFTNQVRKLGAADIDERDSEAIREFTRYQDTQRELKASTNVNSRSDPRLSVEPADTLLVDMERDDVNALRFQHKHAQRD